MADERKIICPECKNDIVLEEGREYMVGDIIECQECGTEVEVVEVKENGDLVVEIVELEK